MKPGGTDDTYVGIEGLVGGQAKISSSEKSQVTICMGVGGSDFIHGFGGADYLYRGIGSDKLYGGAGADYLNGSDASIDYLAMMT